MAGRASPPEPPPADGASAFPAAPRSTTEEEIGSQDRARMLDRFGKRFAPGAVLFREGAPAQEAFLLQEGRVRLIKRIGMSERSLAVIKPGELFGEGALVPGMPYGSTAVALSDCAALVVDRDTFRGLIESHPRIATRAIDQLVLRLRDAEDQIELSMLRGVRSKVTSALLKLAGAASGSATVTVSPLELSARVGLDIETVKRLVHQLREQQYLRIRGERIEIPDIEALRRLHVLFGARDELAGPDPGP